MYPGGF